MTTTSKVVRCSSLWVALIVCISGILTIRADDAVINKYPIIGVFTQPSSSREGSCGGKCLYLAASYVKYLEAAGARVVPVNYYATAAQLDTMLRSVNGVLFPGGGSSFPSSAQYVYDKVKVMNDAGDFFPLWGTCMGFQWLLIAQSRDQDVLDPKHGQMDSYNLSIPLELTSTAMDSRLLGEAPIEVVKVLSAANVTLNNHHYGIYPDHLASTPLLAGFFHVLSTNKDRQGVPFVSTIEAFDYPIFGTQWHPEKNAFEWQMENGVPAEAINHGAEAVVAAQYTADFFVRQARRNSHKFSSAAAEDGALIYNYAPAKTTGSFVQTYFFNW